ncbi:phage protein NinX family protein [Acidihalobacter prosperus]
MSEKPEPQASNGEAALVGAPLDMAVAQAVRLSPQLRDGTVYVNGVRFAPSRDWADGGPLIERYRIRIQVLEAPWTGREVLWSAEFPAFGFERQGFAHGWSSGPTPLVAAMRALVEARGMYREAEHEGAGWGGADTRDDLALVVELIRMAGTYRPLELHEVQALVQAAEAAGIPLAYRFRQGLDAARSKALNDDLAHLSALGVIRMRRNPDGSGVRYQAGSEAESYLQRYKDLLRRHASTLHAVVRAIMG